MVAYPTLSAILLPCIVPLPGAPLLPSPFLLPSHCLLPRTLRLPLSLGLLRPLLLRLLLLSLRALFFFVLRVRRDNRPEKQKQGGGTGSSNELHGNHPLKFAIGWLPEPRPHLRLAPGAAASR
jgi:hypothetical protein